MFTKDNSVYHVNIILVAVLLIVYFQSLKLQVVWFNTAL